MKGKDYISGLVLLMVAVILFLQARALAVWGEMGPGEGFFPITLSIILAVLSFVIILNAFLKKGQEKETFHILGPRKRKFILYGVSFLIFGLIFPRVGYSLTVAAFLVFILRVVERKSWKTTLMLTAISIIGSYVLFVKAFSIPLPEGILSPIAQLMR